MSRERGPRHERERDLDTTSQMPSPPAVVRPRRSSDLPACLEVLQAVYAKDAYPVQGPSLPFLSSPNTMEAWVATSSPDLANETQDGIETENENRDDSGTKPENIIGHIALSSPSEADVAVARWRVDPKGRWQKIAVLERLFVAPEARGSGVAELLIRTVVEEGRKRGVRVVLFALMKDQGAMRLYERLEWVAFGRMEYKFASREEGKEERETMEAVCYASPP